MCNDEVKIDEDITEKNKNSLYLELVEGNDIEDGDMLDMDSCFKEGVSDEYIDY